MRFLHLHSSFNPGGKELRAAQLINAFGKRVAHSVVSAQPGALGAARAIARGMNVDYPADFPPLAGRPSMARMKAIAEAMRGYDLVLTYNWGAMDAAMAHAVFAERFALPPLVHHEDGFNQDEAQRLKPSRNLWRRIALHRAAALVVPSRRLEQIALTKWGQPRGKVHRIVNGIATDAYTARPDPRALSGLAKQQGDAWVGTLAGLRPVKNLPRLVRAFAVLPARWQLVICGEGPEREAILAEAARLGLAARVHLPGFADPAKVMPLFDVFALSSDSEQFPISVVEAMAAAKPVVSPAVGDVAAMVAEPNHRFIAPAGDEAALAAALRELAADPALRLAIGEANRARAAVEYDEARMVAAYARVYGEAMGRAIPR